MTEDFIAGLKIIGEMTKEEIIDELLKAQHTAYNKREISDLKGELINFRLGVIRKRMINEAGMEEYHGFLGTHLHEKEE